MSAIREMDRRDGIIAVTPESIAELVGEVRRLRVENERLRAEIEEIKMAWREEEEYRDYVSGQH